MSRADRGRRRRVRVTKSLFTCGWLAIVFALVVTGVVVRVPFIGNDQSGNRVDGQTLTTSSIVPAAYTTPLLDLPAVSGRTLPLMITYHNIAPGVVNPYSITPDAFAEQMQLLADAGFHTIRAADLAAWMRGATLPPRSVLISFDDGDVGVWKYAEPVLAGHGFFATAFIITGRIGRGSAYMTWPELGRLAATGRWDLEAHTRAGHGYVPVDDRGHTGAFLVSREWLPAKHRIETYAEYERRVTTDLDGDTADLAAHGFPAPTLFAYPFSAASSADPRITAFITAEIRRRYAASMLDDGHGGVTTQDELAAHQLSRLDVLGGDTLPQLVSQIVGSTPMPLVPMRPLDDLRGWRSGSGSGTWQRSRHGDVVELATDANGWKEMDYAPTRTIFWRGYTAAVTLAGLRRHATAGLAIGTGDSRAVTAAVSAGWLQVRTGGRQQPAYQAKLPTSDVHRVRVTTTDSTVQVQVDALPAVTLRTAAPAGGLGVFVSATGRAVAYVTDLAVV